MSQIPKFWRGYFHTQVLQISLSYSDIKIVPKTEMFLIRIEQLPVVAQTTRVSIEFLLKSCSTTHLVVALLFILL